MFSQSQCEGHLLNSVQPILVPNGDARHSVNDLTEPQESAARADATVSGARRTPVLTIDGNSGAGLELRDLWAHRDLFYFLAWRDVKVRYKQTALGAAWALLQPLITMVVFTLLFGRLARVPSEGEPYAIFSYAGLLPWNFFTSAVTNSSNSLVSSTNLITKVYFPRLLVPTAAVGAVLVDIAIASIMLFVIMPVYGVGFHASLLMFYRWSH